jgi:hypothetical protein
MRAGVISKTAVHMHLLRWQAFNCCESTRLAGVSARSTVVVLNHGSIKDGKYVWLLETRLERKNMS